MDCRAAHGTTKTPYLYKGSRNATRSWRCSEIGFLVMVLVCLAAFLMLLLSQVEGRNKKVVIHVPFKVKKIKHTHTIYKTIHHHHAHHEHEPMYLGSPSENHEHFHHMHIHEEPGPGQHSQPVPGIGLPDFLPDVPLELPLQLSDAPRDLPPPRHLLPLFRRA